MKPLLVFGALKKCIHFFETPGISQQLTKYDEAMRSCSALFCHHTICVTVYLLKFVTSIFFMFLYGLHNAIFQNSHSLIPHLFHFIFIHYLHLKFC
jgi:hypothetical protein